jgi:hypothetical protein
MGDKLMFIEIDKNGYATGAYSETEQEWATFEVDKIPDDLNCYKVVDGILVFQDDIKENIEKADENEKMIQSLQEYLDGTDWYVVRYMETGKAIPEGISEHRQAARDEISRLEELY